MFFRKICGSGLFQGIRKDPNEVEISSEGSFSGGNGPRCICLSYHCETNTNIIFTYTTGICDYYSGVSGCGRKCVYFR